MAKPKSGQQLDSLLRKAVELHRQGKLERAQATYERYMKFNPRDAETLGLLAVSKFQQGHHSAAFDLMKRACALAPEAVGLLCNFGRMLFEAGNYDEAEQTFRSCLGVDPKFASAAHNLGIVLMRTHRFREAEEALKLAAELNPQDGDIRLALAGALYENKKIKEAISHYKSILDRDEINLTAASLHLLAKLHICDWRNFHEERARFLSTLSAVHPANVATVPSPYLMTLISDDPAECLMVAKVRSMSTDTPSAPIKGRRQSTLSRKVRIAYVSADFRDHATSYLMADVVELHDRANFDVIGVSYGPRKTDAMRRRMEAAFDRFLDVEKMSGAQTSEVMQGLQIDIAIDLQGFNQYNRMLEIFRPRAAPIQVLYLGWPGTSGATFYDYVVADSVIIPKENLSFFSESVVWLPNSYQANDRKRAVAPTAPTRSECSLPDDAFVYSCFNNTFKILPEIFDAWMRVLGSVPNSVLWLLATTQEAQENLRREAAARRIEPDRLVFAPILPNAEHLARLRHIDLVLDTLPYNAHTTASDALWQGVPVLTCTGRSFAGRVATSLLRNCHLGELAVASMAEYEALAVKLAREPAALSHLKNELANARDGAPLFDSIRFTRDLERAFAEMKSRHDRGERPSFLDVGALT